MFHRLATIVALSLVVAACGSTATSSVELVSPAAAAEVIDSGAGDLIVLDIRTPEEFEAGTIPDAINIDFYADDFTDQLAALDKDATYVMFCRSGNRSAQAAEHMRDLEFTDVSEVQGGIVNWSEAGGPVVLP